MSWLAEFLVPTVVILVPLLIYFLVDEAEQYRKEQNDAD